MQNLSTELREQLYGQTSGDPFLMLVSLTHDSFGEILFVNDVVDIVSNGKTYSAFPIEIVLSPDDGESTREVSMKFDNVSLEIIGELRTVTTPIAVTIDMVLASDPDTVQLNIGELKLKSITYTAQTISAVLYMDDFLSTEMASEKYTPKTFPGIF